MTDVPLPSLEDKVVVITGGASGIGRAIATRAAKEKARLMLADIEEGPLKETAAAFSAQGIEVGTKVVDVSKREDVMALADATYSKFGAAHVVVNNAGVSPTPGPIWADDDRDWEWLMGVNLEGVRSGIRAFVPRMLDAKTPGHVVNVASLAGISTLPTLGSYVVTKHAVVALSEILYHDLQTVDANIGVSVVCPAFVKTRIHESHRNRPGAGAAPASDDPAKLHPVAQMVAQWIEKSPPPSLVADAVVDACLANDFWVIPMEHARRAAKERMQALVDRLPPANSLTVKPLPEEE